MTSQAQRRAVDQFRAIAERHRAIARVVDRAAGWADAASRCSQQRADEVAWQRTVADVSTGGEIPASWGFERPVPVVSLEFAARLGRLYERLSDVAATAVGAAVFDAKSSSELVDAIFAGWFDDPWRVLELAMDQVDQLLSTERQLVLSATFRHAAAQRYERWRREWREIDRRSTGKLWEGRFHQVLMSEREAWVIEVADAPRFLEAGGLGTGWLNDYAWTMGDLIDQAAETMLLAYRAAAHAVYGPQLLPELPNDPRPAGWPVEGIRPSDREAMREWASAVRVTSDIIWRWMRDLSAGGVPEKEREITMGALEMTYAEPVRQVRQWLAQR